MKLSSEQRQVLSSAPSLQGLFGRVELAQAFSATAEWTPGPHRAGNRRGATGTSRDWSGCRTNPAGGQTLQGPCH